MCRFLRQMINFIFLLGLLVCLSCSQKRKIKSSTPTPAPPITTYYHILLTGQSLSTGSWGMDSLSGKFSDQQPYQNFMLSQPASQVNQQGALGTIAPLIPLKEPYYEFAIKRFVETPVSGMANTLAAYDNPQNPTIGVVGTAHGYGAQPYSQIKKNPVSSIPPVLLRYAYGQKQIQEVYQEIKTNPNFTGASYNPLGIAVVHGETDQLQGNASFYESYLNEFQSDYQADMFQFLAANNEPPIASFPMFITQMNSRGPYEMALSQLDAAKNNDNIYMVGPTYQYIYFDKTHLNGAAEYRNMGENIGKVMHKVGIQKQDWKPLSPSNIIFINQLITIQFHVPVGNLVFDAPPHSIDSITGAKTYYKNYGFEYVDDSGSARIAQNGVSIGPDNKSVQIYLDKPPTGSNPRIKYAAQKFSNVLPGASAACRHGDLASGIQCYGGNLRDSDNAPSPAIDGSGIPLYNWCVTFDEPLRVDLFTKVILQGAYDQASGTMHTKLVERGMLPAVEPFTALGYNYVNADESGTTIASSLLNASGTDQAVDWVLIELLDRKNKDSVIQVQTGIVQSDGDIVDPSGVSNGVRFNSIVTQDYHLRIRHRNHLQVSTLYPVRINKTPASLDFTKLKNTTYQKQIGAVKGLWAGDADHDQTISENDRLQIQSHSGGFGYYNSDINLDGVINAKDRSLVWNNRKLFSIDFKTEKMRP